MAAKVRGSELLKQRYTERDLAELLRLGEREDVQLVEFFPLGIPDPDGGVGGWMVGHGGLQGLLDALLKQRHIPHVIIRPIGVPVDQFFVQARAGSAQAGR